MNRVHHKCSYCETTASVAAADCPGCRAELRCGAHDALYVVALVVSIIMWCRMLVAVHAAEARAGWVIGLAVLISGWGLLDWLYVDRVHFRRRRARDPDV
ncbi:hypothetical protein R75461_07225 [Paraburkholderia nemoris]|uniref:hypothetical protein n=1 Tax=Paraburkholderia nemoris TaxID=2793076 RepID=UPI00190D9F34|nr:MULTISPECIES: hypothetical protein [Paraburkholderia]MBK3787082.1 hypothetical protein [Paraburkholderia aspalathi]CAE6845355.1 hypothetical protein R75461_07225 [Paraburkholderia nemoris]